MRSRITSGVIHVLAWAGAAGMMAGAGVARAALPTVLDLGEAGASFHGEYEMTQSGYRVVGVGDVNGDHFDDLAVSAPAVGGSAGKIYLFFGKSLGLEPFTSLAEADASFLGEAAGDQAGLGLASAGDFNRDGLMDIAIGAPFSSQKGYASGKVYMVYGRKSGWIKDMPLSQADVSFVAESAYMLAGFSMAAVGDINKDTYPDLVIGAHGASTSTGRVYVVLGGAASNFKRDMELGSFPSFVGEATNNYAGFSVAGLGDVNKDGYMDFLIGAYGNSQKAPQAGKSYLIYGKSGTWSKGAPLVQVSSYFLGQTSKDYAGYAVSGAGDVDKDGYADFIIGAPGRDKGGDASGMVSLVYGRSSVIGAMDLGQVDASLNGVAAGDASGGRLAKAGDVDGDGYADFLVSAAYSDRAGTDAGAAYLVRGGAKRLAGSLTLSSASMVMVGELSLDQAGWGLDGAGDVDGDGFDDLLVSAYGSDYAGAASGMTYLVFTGPMVDLDGDGFSVAMGDCNDNNAAQNPAAVEIPGNGVDEDCKLGDLRPRW